MTEEVWIHYAREKLPEFPPEVDASTGRRAIKPPSWCYHFALGTAWRDWAHKNLSPRGYMYKYQLTNLAGLKILPIDGQFVDGLELESDCAFDWDLFARLDFDGVLVRREEIIAKTAYPDPWFIFASARESDELVIWRNAQVIHRQFDWPKEYFLRSHAKQQENLTAVKNQLDLPAILRLRALGVDEDIVVNEEMESS